MSGGSATHLFEQPVTTFDSKPTAIRLSDLAGGEVGHMNEDIDQPGPLIGAITALVPSAHDHHWHSQFAILVAAKGMLSAIALAALAERLGAAGLAFDRRGHNDRQVWIGQQTPHDRNGAKSFIHIASNTATNNGGGINISSGSLTISGGTIGGAGIGNTAALLGGGIYTQSTTSINGTLIEDNTASGSGGGGIHVSTASGTATIQNATIKKNKALDAGGGIYVATGGTVNISKSAIDQNSLTAAGTGGGVYNESIFNAKETSVTANTASVNTSFGGGLYNNAGTASLKNVTISNNTANTGSGGGIKVVGGTVKTNNVTIAYNSAPNSVGGGIHVDATGTLEIGNTILSDNSALGVIECDLGGGTVTDKDHNLIHQTTTCGFSTVLNNIFGSSANLAALAGTTPAYHALNAGSPAIDKDDAFGSATQACEANDTRGVARPFGSHCDIGAYEKN